MGPELPFLGAGALAIGAGAVKEGKWPQHTLTGIIGTIALVLFASATADTKVAPLVRAIGLLFLLAASMAAVKAVTSRKKKQHG